MKVTEEQINNKELIALVISLRKTLLILSGIIWIVGDCSSDLGNCAWKPNAFTGSKFMLIGLEEASRINYHSSRKFFVDDLPFYMIETNERENDENHVIQSKWKQFKRIEYGKWKNEMR